MPSHRLARSGVAALLAACIALPAVGVEGFLYTREVQVPTSGWARVPLDLPAVQHMAPGGADLHVFAPGGTEVAVRVAPAVQRSERREVTVVKVDKGEGGWTLLLDVGAEPAPHERLFFALAEMTVAPSVRLEGSLDDRADNKSWHPLATGDMFRLGEREGLQQISLSYPSTEDRYLRLAWPQAAGFPRVETVEVETVSGPSLAFATRGAECQAAGPRSTACALVLPAPGQVVRRLTLDVEGPGAVGFRLYAAREGTWQLLHEGTWQRAGSRTQHFVDGAGEPLAGSVLRLELFGAGKAAPRLTGWGVDLAAQTVVFQAAEPGRYVIAYGGAARRNHRADEPPAGAEMAGLAAGPEKEQAAAAVPEAAAGTSGPGAPLGRSRFDSSWTVIAPSAKPGDLVRLELPDLVYVNARPDLGDLRLAVGPNQIPFFRWTPPEPALAGGTRGLHPATAHRAGESEAEVTLPAAGLPLTELALSTPGGPLRRMVGVRYLEPIRRSRLPRLPDDPRERQPVARTLWECDPDPPLPCRAALPLPGAAPKILSIRLDDGDNPPLAALDVELWRRRDVLMFIWPQAAGNPEPVRLLAGSERLTAPAYDFATLGEELPARPWQPADLDLAGTAPKAGGKPWTRWAMPVALALAGVFLLLLLRRILAEH